MIVRYLVSKVYMNDKKICNYGRYDIHYYFILSILLNKLVQFLVEIVIIKLS